MFNQPLATNTLSMRPGLIAGSYPEREEGEVGCFDRAFHSLQGRMTRLTINRRAGLLQVCREIGLQGESLGALTDDQLAVALIDLRRGFRRFGLSDPLCIRSLALIREMAWRSIGQRHYDAQVMGGWVMLHGRMAEMETGEGKTLTATLAAATAALAGIPAHVLTVNEYLVQRDADAMGPLYRALGLTVGSVIQNMTTQERRAGYACDITYCTNKQVAFDYLRDRLLMGNDRSRLRLQLESAYSDRHRLGNFLLRGLCFAIVDEADSVLIDEARTPLILTRSLDSSAEHAVYTQALELARRMRKDRDFAIDPMQRCVQLSLAGQRRLTQIKPTAKGVWQNRRRCEEVIGQALHALHLLHKDRDYLVHDDQVLIVDANTGRTMPDRSWERGLHQLVEAKEGCPLSDAREQLGRLTYQRFFSRYLRLAGMTGTAREVGDELWSVYGLRVQRIPLHRPCRRRQLPTRIFACAQEKWAALIGVVKDLQATGQPVLIGTGSVAESEVLSRFLSQAGIDHQVLNARQDEAEAEIVAAAGSKRQVTVATNMAGRGTDIPLAEGVAELGGLHVVATCRNEAKRIDRQLFGRCARQGDPGSYEVLLSLEDELIQQNCRPMLVNVLRRFAINGGRVPNRIIPIMIRRVQRRIEDRHYQARRMLLRHDRLTGRMLAFSGNME